MGAVAEVVAHDLDGPLDLRGVALVQRGQEVVDDVLAQLSQLVQQHGLLQVLGAVDVAHRGHEDRVQLTHPENNYSFLYERNQIHTEVKKERYLIKTIDKTRWKIVF